MQSLIFGSQIAALPESATDVEVDDSAHAPRSIGKTDNLLDNEVSAPLILRDPAVGETQDFPCSPGQRRFLLIDQLDPLSSSLNVAVRWRLQGELDNSEVQFAIDSLVERHQALRTFFVRDDGEPIQRVLDHLDVPVRYLDLRHESKTAARVKAEQTAQHEARVPFAIGSAPLLRVTHLQLRGDTSILLVTAHHAICDGWSMSLLAAEFVELCVARRTGRKLDLDPLEINYGDYSLWKTEAPNAVVQRRTDDYWRQQLSGVRRFEIETDYARPATFSSNAGVLSASLERRVVDALGSLASNNGCTLFMVACASLFAILHRRSGESDIAIGSQLIGRDDADLEALVGPCVNTVVLRSDLRKFPRHVRFLDLLKQAHTTVVEAFEHQNVAPETLLSILHPKRDLSRNAMFSINFIFQRMFFTRSPTELTLTDLPSYPTGASCDMDIVMVERSDGWHASIEYNNDLFAETTIRKLLEEFVDMLRAVSRDAEQTIVIGDKTAQPSSPPARADAALERSATSADLSDVENKLAAIWRAVLGVNDIAPDADFFELGGHSLLAARLLARIDNEFGQRLTLPMLFKAATLREQAKLLGDVSQGGELRSVVKLNVSGTKPPLIAIVAMGNTASYYYLLARRLGVDQPFTIVQPFDYLHPRDTMPQSIEAVAAEYIKMIRAAQPSGPYRLVGWCITATLAFEIAQQLRAANLSVSQLIFIDAWAPGHRKRMPRWRAFMEELSYRAQLIADDASRIIAGKQSLLGFLRNRNLFARLLNALGYEAPRKVLELKDAAGEHGRWLLEFLDTLAKNYEPRPYEGELLIFRSSKEPNGRWMDESMGWKPLSTRPVRVIPIAGDHFSIFSSPGIDEMTDHIAACTSIPPLMSR